jgi:hypothetical protein
MGYECIIADHYSAIAREDRADDRAEVSDFDLCFRTEVEKSPIINACVAADLKPAWRVAPIMQKGK